MEDIKVSVIIPVYNVAPWLAECLDSVLGQDYENLQIICVNDGSTDSSLEILEKYAAKDSRILLLNQENKGLSAARNRAIENADGKYISFLDSDDLFTDGIIRKLVNKSESDSLEILRFCSEAFFENENLKKRGRAYVHKYCYPGIYTGRDFYKKLKENNEYSAVVWCSFYLREFISSNRLKFVYPLHEDELFTFTSYLYAQKVGFIPEIGVRRRYREGSIMTGERSIINIYSYYLTVQSMVLLCYENRDRLVDYPEFFEQADFIRNLAVEIYENAPDLIQSQVKDSFERSMLKDLDYYRNANNFVAALKNEHEKLEKKDLELISLKRELLSVYHSKAYKAGNLLAGPIRKIKRLFHDKNRTNE